MKKKIYSCHQPNFLPWIGYFHKILSSDYFVLLDEVQYTKNSVANRNSIKTRSGSVYITVPISKKFNGTSFFTYKEAKIAIKNWYIKPLKSIEQNYSKSKYFDLYYENINEIFKMDNFCQMNIEFIYFILKELKIKTKILLMSELKNVYGSNNELLISIGKNLGAELYLSGNGAKKYNDVSKFKKEGIDLVYQDYSPISYCQMYEPFIENLSVLDLLFNEGPKGEKLLKEQANY